MKTLGNLVWLVAAGWWLALGYLAAGVVSVATIVAAPLGVQSFKLAGFALWPFGRAIVRRPNADLGLSTLGNAVWFIVSGWWLALLHLVAALVLAVSIIGLPFALVSARMARLALFPFGKMIVPASAAAGGTVLAVPGVRA